MTNRLAEPVTAPDGSAYTVRIYRSGTLGRFPSAQNTPRPGGLLVVPLLLLGGLLHLAVFRRGWTVEVTPWHNLPGPRHRERLGSQAAASARAAALSAGIETGEWQPA